LLIALFAYHSQAAVAWLLGYIIAVAAYGSYTSSPWIILKQGGLAIVALVFTLVFGV
jgi:putative membrane protein